MKKINYEIIPYSKYYEAALLELEKEASQGTFIQLEILRDCFRTRALTFDKSQIYLTVDKDGQLLGVLGVALVVFVINGKKSNMAYYYDIRVKKEWQGYGINTKMAQYSYQNFCKPNNIRHQFTTIKDSNKSAFNSATNVGVKLYKHPFLYLTIPTHLRLKKAKTTPILEKLAVTCSSTNPKLNSYLLPINEQIKVWRTHLIYRLKLIKIHPLLSLLNKWNFMFRKSFYKTPVVGDYLNCSTLMYRETPTVAAINATLSIMQKQQVNYLLVVCSKKSQLYKLLKRYSIYSYKYNLHSTFQLNKKDYIELDVRCL